VTRQDIFSVLGALGAVITLVTAVMFYFGWRRSYVQAQAMGIDVSLFGYSSQDYVLQSISSFYLPLLLLAGIGLGCVWLHGQVVDLLQSQWLATGGRRAAAAAWTRWIALAGFLLTAVCVLFAAAAGVQAPGVQEERIGAAGSPEVRYRTTGLRLLARSGGKVLLVHDGWSPRTGTVIVLSDDDQLGWEFSR
jgi:hypothetical protein